MCSPDPVAAALGLKINKIAAKKTTKYCTVILPSAEFVLTL